MAQLQQSWTVRNTFVELEDEEEVTHRESRKSLTRSESWPGALRVRDEDKEGSTVDGEGHFEEKQEMSGDEAPGQADSTDSDENESVTMSLPSSCPLAESLASSSTAWSPVSSNPYTTSPIASSTAPWSPANSGTYGSADILAAGSAVEVPMLALQNVKEVPLCCSPAFHQEEMWTEPGLEWCSQQLSTASKPTKDLHRTLRKVKERLVGSKAACFYVVDVESKGIWLRGFFCSLSESITAIEERIRDQCWLSKDCRCILVDCSRPLQKQHGSEATIGSLADNGDTLYVRIDPPQRMPDLSTKAKRSSDRLPYLDGEQVEEHLNKLEMNPAPKQVLDTALANYEGSIVIQELIRVAAELQCGWKDILQQVFLERQDVLKLARHSHGNFPLQVAIGVDEEYAFTIAKHISSLENHEFHKLATNMCACRVVCKLLRRVPELIYQQVKSHIVSLSRDEFGKWVAIVALEALNVQGMYVELRMLCQLLVRGDGDIDSVSLASGKHSSWAIQTMIRDCGHCCFEDGWNRTSVVSAVATQLLIVSRAKQLLTTVGGTKVFEELLFYSQDTRITKLAGKVLVGVQDMLANEHLGQTDEANRKRRKQHKREPTDIAEVCRALLDKSGLSAEELNNRTDASRSEGRSTATARRPNKAKGSSKGNKQGWSHSSTGKNVLALNLSEELGQEPPPTPMAGRMPILYQVLYVPCVPVACSQPADWWQEWQ